MKVMIKHQKALAKNTGYGSNLKHDTKILKLSKKQRKKFKFKKRDTYPKVFPVWKKDPFGFPPCYSEKGNTKMTS